MSEPNDSNEPKLRAPVRRGPRPSRKAEVPAVLRPKVWLPILLVLGIGYGAWAAFDHWQARRTVFAIVDSDGAPLSNLKLEFFECDGSFVGPSPTPRIGELFVTDGAEIVVGWDMVPGDALLRIEADGFGVGSGYVRAGRPRQKIDLGPPCEVRGRVAHTIGEARDWIAGARVQALGGGARGVLLREAVTDTDGSFVLGGLSSELAHITIRVFADGFGVRERSVDPSEPLGLIELTPTDPLRGRLIGCEGFDIADREIRVYQFPGVSARTDADGNFTFEHLPKEQRYPLVVADLDPRFTHAKCSVYPGGAPAELEVEPAGWIRGVAVDALTRDPIRGTKVLHKHGPNGIEVVECDSWGRFELGRVPAGLVWVIADVVVEKRDLSHGRVVRETLIRNGEVPVEMASGGVESDVVLLIRPAR